MLIVKGPTSCNRQSNTKYHITCDIIGYYVLQFVYRSSVYVTFIQYNTHDELTDGAKSANLAGRMAISLATPMC